MTIHLHGTPITPRAELMKLAGRNFCVSYAAPGDVATVHKIGQMVMLDNGAFSFWRQGVEVDDEFWAGYYDWCEKWLAHRTTWAVIPDVIDGTVEENDRLVRMWPFGPDQAAPVWHLHEPLDRLMGLCADWSKVCVGSSGQYAVIGTDAWHHRMHRVFNTLSTLDPKPWVHMLRGMALVRSVYPFASVDSTDIARNHNRPQNDVVGMALRWDQIQCPASWEYREQLALEAAA